MEDMNTNFDYSSANGSAFKKLKKGITTIKGTSTIF